MGTVCLGVLAALPIVAWRSAPVAVHSPGLLIFAVALALVGLIRGCMGWRFERVVASEHDIARPQRSVRTYQRSGRRRASCAAVSGGQDPLLFGGEDAVLGLSW